MIRTVPMTALLLVLSVCLASADTDGNGINKPDTILIESTDNTEVSISITGKDSLADLATTSGISGLPVDPQTGSAIVPLEIWPTFPILLTACGGRGGSPATGGYELHLKVNLGDSIRVELVSAEGQTCEIAFIDEPVAKQTDIWSKVKRTWYPRHVWDERNEVAIDSGIGDTVCVASFRFSDYVLPGNIFVTYLCNQCIYQETIPPKVNFFRRILPPLPKLTPEEHFERLVERQLETRIRNGATEEKLQEYREYLYSQRERYLEGWGR